MTYRIRESLAIIPLSEESAAVFDPQSGDTHFFEGTSFSILKAIMESDNGVDEDALVSALGEEYAASEEEIREDATLFLGALIKMGVVTAV